MSARAFLSYAHADDKHSNGRIREIARDLAGEYEILSGESLRIFLDKEEELDGLRWGEEWKGVIDSHLEETAFFLPVLSPTYLKSSECRREFLDFHAVATVAEDVRLILPILFADLRSAAHGDELAAIAERLQWVDWTEVRFEERTSTASRKAVHRMARRLLQAQEEIDAAVAASVGGDQREPDDQSADDDDAPGMVDRIADAEQAINRYGVLLSNFNDQLSLLHDPVVTATPRLQSARSFARKLPVYRKLAEDLQAPVQECLTLATQLSESTAKADPGLRDLLRISREQLSAEDTEPGARRQLEKFLATVRDTSASLVQMTESAEQADAQVKVLQGHSRELRPTIAQLRKALALLRDSGAAFATWRDSAVTTLEEAKA